MKKQYLLRKEHGLGILFDRKKRSFSFIPNSETALREAGTDVEIVDYIDWKPEGHCHRFGAPITLFIDITSLCQCSCWYCYNKSGAKRPNELTGTDIRRIISDFAVAGGMELRLSGGEPTLHPELKDFIELAEYYSLRTILVSNGMMSEDILDYLKKSPVTAYYISIQGEEELHDSIRGAGSYQKCIESVTALAESGFLVRLSMTFHKQNVGHVGHIVKLAVRLGVDVTVNPLRPFGDTFSNKMLEPGEHYRLVQLINSLQKTYTDTRITTPWSFLLENPLKPVLSAYKRVGCGNTGISVTSTGDCYSCGQMSLREFHLGNIRQDDIISIWRKSRQSCAIVNAQPASKCLDCSFFKDGRCFGGCAATALTSKGELDAGDPYCFVDLIGNYV